MIHQEKLKKICDEMNIDFNEVKNRKRRKVEHVQARYLYMLFLKEIKKMKLIEIGLQFTPKYDHTTVISGLKMIKSDLNNKNYEYLNDIYEKIKPEPFTALKYIKK